MPIPPEAAKAVEVAQADLAERLGVTKDQTRVVSVEAIEWRDALVQMSDGRAIAGKLHVVRDRLLIYNDTQKKRYPVGITQIQKLETILEKESMEKRWLLK